MFVVPKTSVLSSLKRFTKSSSSDVILAFEAIAGSQSRSLTCLSDNTDTIACPLGVHINRRVPL